MIMLNMFFSCAGKPPSWFIIHAISKGFFPVNLMTKLCFLRCFRWKKSHKSFGNRKASWKEIPQRAASDKPTRSANLQPVPMHDTWTSKKTGQTTPKSGDLWPYSPLTPQAWVTIHPKFPIDSAEINTSDSTDLGRWLCRSFRWPQRWHSESSSVKPPKPSASRLSSCRWFAGCGNGLGRKGKLFVHEVLKQRQNMDTFGGDSFENFFHTSTWNVVNDEVFHSQNPLIRPCHHNNMLWRARQLQIVASFVNLKTTWWNLLLQAQKERPSWTMLNPFFHHGHVIARKHKDLVYSSSAN